MNASNPNEHLTYTLRIDLVGSKPPIWRRIRVDGQITLDRLHDAIQAAFGWTDSHLHAFQIGSERYRHPDSIFWGDSDFWDETKMQLADMVSQGQRFAYQYDFGNDWLHQIIVEKVTPRKTMHSSFASLITGKRACPPEDIGGIWAYENFLKTMANTHVTKDRDLLNWAENKFNPEAFDLAEAQKMVEAVSCRPQSAKKHFAHSE